ncbi:unnamed protein product [Caenorhabditis bovis]|uniref:Integrase zinc-binding domain-containing protein n=1 Tax=Caenorhabditis bovis TaxID=2654633 RepID=A0A8S1EX25_9PELO|nr:unnamed protein product [Caenorhabditis bovis]
MMLNDQEIVVDNMVVEGYEEIAVADMNELVVQSEGGNESIAYEDDDMRSEDGDGYGGMSPELYADIVEYKRTGLVPSSIDKRMDRSAPSHWRSKCTRFTMADDNETLLYYNPTSPVHDQPKVVVKKGEVRKVLERIHELIGHLGQKRTQIVVLRKLYWRSVRQDVKNFVISCDFCNQKKLEGRKIVKSPVDITSENFDINVSIRDSSLPNGDRLEFTLVGYNEQDVRDAAYTRMTSYTFKETSNEYRSRFSLREPQVPTFRRQPYIKRNGDVAIGFLLPYQQRSRTMEPEFIEIFEQRSVPYAEDGTEYEQVVEEIVDSIDMKRRRGDGQPITLDGQQLNMKFKEEEVEEEVDMDSSMNSSQAGPSRTAQASTSTDKNPNKDADQDMNQSHTANRIQREMEVDVEEQAHTSRIQSNQMAKQQEHRMLRYPVKRSEADAEYVQTSRRRTNGSTTTTSLTKKRKGDQPSISGMAARFSMAIGDSNNIDTKMMQCNNPNYVAQFDGSSSRPELIGLPPVCLMPSLDPEVTLLQKEFLQRQLKLQKLQEKILQSQYDASMRIPITRYVQSTEHEVQEENLEDQELNVMDEHGMNQVYEENHIHQ